MAVQRWTDEMLDELASNAEVLNVRKKPQKMHLKLDRLMTNFDTINQLS